LKKQQPKKKNRLKNRVPSPFKAFICTIFQDFSIARAQNYAIFSCFDLFFRRLLGRQHRPSTRNSTGSIGGFDRKQWRSSPRRIQTQQQPRDGRELQ
jgi:hypothetical protein